MGAPTAEGAGGQAGAGPPASSSAPGATARPGAGASPLGSVRIERGACRVFFAYDIGQSIDLERAAARLSDEIRRGTIHRSRRAPKYFEFRPPPVRVTQQAPALDIAGFHAAVVVDCTIWDFGAVSVMYTIPLTGGLSSLLPLSAALYDNDALLADSRRRVEAIAEALGPAVIKPMIADVVEDYVVYEIDELSPRCDVARLIAEQPRLLAQILRSEPGDVSSQEVADALAARISYAADDAALVDWNASMLFQRDASDVRAVLEYANVELLEMRFLDNLLDTSLEQAYATLARRIRRRAFLASDGAADLHRIARLQMDSALLFEGVNNALKLLGDQYLARVYRLASDRLHLPEWDASIIRKLNTLESIYQKMSDRQTTRRMEILEWIIIALIAAEIVLSLLPSRPAANAPAPTRQPPSPGVHP